jgi:hypothetical protein
VGNTSALFRLKVTLTGPPERIDDFQSLLGGNGIAAGDPGSWNPLSSLLDDLLGGATKAAQRRRRAARPSQHGHLNTQERRG